ncbi:MAG TPA: alcohol dehydrogenase catalytic domain-containing protein [Bacteroidales bacterium]|nr:alcohol dehydrogenase catalytic domain-containing protein [Bacteroidales bacterium]
MKTMRLTGIRQMQLMEVPEPEIRNGKDVKIKMSVVGVCGSDIHYYAWGAIGSQVVKYPFAVGHEGAGIVTEVGSNVTKVKKGDLIAIDPAMPCFECDQCRAGRHHTCRKLKFLGCPGQAEGCLSEYIIMPEDSCFPLPANLQPDHGSISEPLAIGLYSVRKSGNIRGLNIGILGFGPIGMSVLLAAKASMVNKTYVTDKIDRRLSYALNEGASYAGNILKQDIISEIMNQEPLGLDVVYECCGQQEAVRQGINILKPGGKLIVVGIPEFDTWNIDVEKTRRKEIMIQYIRRQVDCVEPSISMMENGMIDVSNMVTHRFPFDRTGEAFDLVESYGDGVMKAMIDFPK